MIAGAQFPNGKEWIYITRQSIFDIPRPKTYGPRVFRNVRRNIEARRPIDFSIRVRTYTRTYMYTYICELFLGESALS